MTKVTLKNVRVSYPKLYEPVATFNDDDYYVYWDGSKRLAAHYSAKSPRPVPLPGQVVVRGMRAKDLGLVT